MAATDFRITVNNDHGQNDARFVKNMNDNERKNTGDDELTPEEKEVKMRTLWVGGVSDQCEEDVLYELFMNAGPLEKVHHPQDKVSKKKKAFAFIVYEHEESIRYAYELFNGIELYGQRLRLQHKETGLGINNRQNGGMMRGGGLRGGGGGGQHARSFSTSDLMAGRRDGGGHADDRSRGPPPDTMWGERGHPDDMLGERGRGHQHPADRMMEERGRGFSDRGFNNGMESRGHGQHFQDDPFRNQFPGGGGQSNQFPDPYAQNAPFHVQSPGVRGMGYNQFHHGGGGGYNQMNQSSRRPYPDFQQSGYNQHPPLPRDYDPAPPPPLPPMPRDYDRPAPPPPPPRDHDTRDRDRRSSRDPADYHSRDRHRSDDHGRDHRDQRRDSRHRDEGRDSRHRDEGRDSRHRDDHRDRSSHRDGGSWHHDNRR